MKYRTKDEVDDLRRQYNEALDEAFIVIENIDKLQLFITEERLKLVKLNQKCQILDESVRLVKVEHDRLKKNKSNRKSYLKQIKNYPKT